jgi:hypothetical protein
MAVETLFSILELPFCQPYCSLVIFLVKPGAEDYAKGNNGNCRNIIGSMSISIASIICLLVSIIRFASCIQLTHSLCNVSKKP